MKAVPPRPANPALQSAAFPARVRGKLRAKAQSRNDFIDEIDAQPRLPVFMPRCGFGHVRNDLKSRDHQPVHRAKRARNAVAREAAEAPSGSFAGEPKCFPDEFVSGTKAGACKEGINDRGHGR